MSIVVIVTQFILINMHHGIGHKINLLNPLQFSFRLVIFLKLFFPRPSMTFAVILFNLWIWSASRAFHCPVSPLNSQIMSFLSSLLVPTTLSSPYVWTCLELTFQCSLLSSLCVWAPSGGLPSDWPHTHNQLLPEGLCRPSPPWLYI